MDDLTKLFSLPQLGIYGFLVATFVCAIKTLWASTQTIAKEHAAERKDLHEKIIAMSDRQLRVIESNSAIMSELSTIIKGLKEVD